jgi:hypothetical protein
MPIAMWDIVFILPWNIVMVPRTSAKFSISSTSYSAYGFVAITYIPTYQ